MNLGKMETNKKNDKRKFCKAEKGNRKKLRECKDNCKDKFKLGCEVPNCAGELPEF